MASRSRSRTAKQAANLSISGDLLRAAREAGVNLSAALEEALIEKIAAAKRETWIRENAAAIAGYNNAVEETGVFSDSARSF